MKVLIKVEIDESRQWAEANKLYDLLKNYKPVLLPMPEKKKPKDPDEDFAELNRRWGWNACLEEITGETE